MDQQNQPQPHAGQYISPQVVPEHPPYAPVRKPRSAGRWIVRLLLLMVFGVMALGIVGVISIGSVISLGGDRSVQEQYHSLERFGTDKVAVVTLEGAILDGDGFVKKQIDHVRDDPAVKAVVLRVNSPGGTVTGSDYLYHHLTKLVRERQIPLVVSMGGIAASGGYYVSMAVGDAENTIFAEPTTWTGSIGVVIPHYNFAGLMETWQIQEDSIKSHPLKQMGAPTRPMTEEERQIFQALVDDSFGRFKEIVKAGRPKLAAEDGTIDKVATGQVFTTRQALANGLVDREGFIEDAIDRAVALAKLDKGNTQVVKYKYLGGLFDVMLGAQSRSNQSDLAALLDLTSPRAYYLCSWLPPLARNTAP